MIRKISATIVFGASVATLPLAFATNASAKPLKVLAEKTVDATGHVESVGYDAADKVFYLSNFGPALKPADKDGNGYMTKMSLDGKILQKEALPAHGEVMNKPKGNWIENGHLWVTDIDSVWEFDLKTGKSRNLPLPGATFANDATVMGGALYVSDNRSADRIVKITPANFLAVKSPKIQVVYQGGGVHPNGLYPGKSGALLMVGFNKKDDSKGIYSMAPGKQPQLISEKIGMLDGLYRMKNGDLLVTDWVSGTLFQWNKKMGKHDLAKGFKGPADIAVVPNKKGYLVAVPDLVKGEIRLVQLGY
jgi:hypothetical protein